MPARAASTSRARISTGIHYLRTVGDSEAIAERIERQERLVVIGSGWIGAEIAASAREKGCQVTMLEMASLPLERVLGPEIGQIYLDIHREHGVEFLPETTVERFEGEGSVERVVTRDGAAIETDFVVVGIGVAPRCGLAETAGIRVDDGVLVDERLETSVPGVFAAGDVANAHHPFYDRHIRVEHWANARAQGEAAARAMLDQPVAYDEIPYFFSDQYDVGMEYGGFATSWDEVVFRGDVEAREFVAFWLEDGRVVAGMNVNVWDVNEAIRELIRSRQPVGGRGPRRSGEPDRAARRGCGHGRRQPMSSNGHGPDLSSNGHVETELGPMVARARVIDLDAAERAAADLLTALGAGASDHLHETPRRVAAAYAELLTPVAFNPTTFPNDEGYDELVVVRDIPFQSLCAHHLLPFHGHAQIAYLPGERIIGLSKLGRVVDLFARDLQVQERLTVQVADWLEERLEPRGVGVIIEAEHLCMSLRGVQKAGAQTVTSALRGTLKHDPRTRHEFLSLARPA